MHTTCVLLLIYLLVLLLAFCALERFVSIIVRYGICGTTRNKLGEMGLAC